jgi:hypothetical protein
MEIMFRLPDPLFVQELNQFFRPESNQFTQANDRELGFFARRMIANPGGRNLQDFSHFRDGK